MKNKFMCLSMVISFFLTSFAVAQNNRPACTKSTKFYPLYFVCVSSVNTRPIFYSIEISSHISPDSCAPLYFYREANVTVTDQSGAILNNMIINQEMYLYEIKEVGSYFISIQYGLNLFNCLVDKGDGKGGFSVGN